MNSSIKSQPFTHFETVRTDTPSWSTRLLSLPVNLWSRLLDAYERRQSIGSLEALEDRELKDIGIYRSDIYGAVRHGRRSF
jgi:uncharacterized protein YjiS (DUF1127 family)